MKISRLFKQRKMRGKSKSPEAKFREKKAAVDAYLLDAWLRQLRTNPELAQRIAEQRYGSEGSMPRYDDERYEVQPDLLEVLRQAREAKDLLKGELSESKSSWLSDIAEIMKALPGLLANLPQLQQMAQQAKPVTQRIQTQPATKQIEPQHLELSMSMEALMPLVVLEASEALEQLHVNNEQGWLQYLSHTSVEEFEGMLAQYAKNCEIPEIAEGINDFLQQKHVWIRELVELAHSAQQS